MQNLSRLWWIMHCKGWNISHEKTTYMIILYLYEFSQHISTSEYSLFFIRDILVVQSSRTVNIFSMDKFITAIETDKKLFVLPGRLGPGTNWDRSPRRARQHCALHMRTEFSFSDSVEKLNWKHSCRKKFTQQQLGLKWSVKIRVKSYLVNGGASFSQQWLAEVLCILDEVGSEWLSRQFQKLITIIPSTKK